MVPRFVTRSGEHISPRKVNPRPTTGSKGARGEGFRKATVVGGRKYRVRHRVHGYFDEEVGPQAEKSNWKKMKKKKTPSRPRGICS